MLRLNCLLWMKFDISEWPWNKPSTFFVLWRWLDIAALNVFYILLRPLVLLLCYVTRQWTILPMFNSSTPIQLTLIVKLTILLPGFYTMRMLETNSSSNNSSVLGASNGGNNGLLPTSMHTNISTLGAMGSTGDRLDASSDSAVSSMGSERVPSLSDGEWGDAGSDSAQDFHQRYACSLSYIFGRHLLTFHRNSSKYGGPYDYSYSSRLSDAARHPVAQKKHQMFGKRYFQEQSSVPSLPQASTHQSDIPLKYEYEPYGMHHGPTLPHNIDAGAGGPLVNKHQPSHMSQPEMKYSCSLDFVRQNRVNDLVNHNHTYTMPQGTGASPRPQARDKKQRRLDEEHLSRDEKRARSLNVSVRMICPILPNQESGILIVRPSRFQWPYKRLSICQWTSSTSDCPNTIWAKHNCHWYGISGDAERIKLQRKIVASGNWIKSFAWPMKSRRCANARIDCIAIGTQHCRPMKILSESLLHYTSTCFRWVSSTIFVCTAFEIPNLLSHVNQCFLIKFHRIFAILKAIRTLQLRTAYNSQLTDQFSCYQKTTKTAEATRQIHQTTINIILTIRKIEAGIVLFLVGNLQ